MRTPPASPAPTPTLREAVEAWMAYSRELSDENPCPDLGLRAHLKAHARKVSIAALAVPPSGAQERIKALARIFALEQHRALAPDNEFLTSNGIHVFNRDETDDFGFATCPHPDCALFAPAPPETQQ